VPTKVLSEEEDDLQLEIDSFMYQYWQPYLGQVESHDAPWQAKRKRLGMSVVLKPALYQLKDWSPEINFQLSFALIKWVNEYNDETVEECK
jgi:hypothetical protein